MAQIRIASTNIAWLVIATFLAKEANSQDAAAWRTPEVVATAAPATIVDITTSNVLAPEFIRAVADIGLPVEVTLIKNETVRNVIEARCGLVTPAYLESFLAENSGRDLSPSDIEQPAPGKAFAFPHCVRPATVRLPLISSIEALFKNQRLIVDSRTVEASSKGQSDRRSVGSLRLFADSAQAGSDGGFVSTELALKFVRDNPGIRPRAVQEGEPLKVAETKATGTVPLRSSRTVGEVQSTLDSASVSGIVGRARTASLIGDETLLEGECGGVEKGKWPFETAKLDAALKRFELLAPEPLLAPTEIKVMAIDTGYDPSFSAPAIDPSQLGYLRGFRTGDRMDQIAINANGAERVLLPEGFAGRQHGGEVVATLLGGKFLPTVQPFLAKPRITFASIVAWESSGTPYLDIAGIGEAVLIADNSDVQIINVSVSAQERRSSFLKTISGYKGLIVAAAGNSRAHPDFADGDDPYPGSLGGAIGNAPNATVISVGAHDPELKILPFSRNGTEVDLLAPGCLIPTYTLRDGKVVTADLNGTSFAAPLVSMVAAQLARAKMPPREIKERLIISAAVSDRLKRKTYSSGVLDAERALSIWQDVVVFEKKKLDGRIEIATVYGKLESNFGKVSICGDPIRHNQLRMLALSVPEVAGQPPVWRGWKQGASSLEPIESCPQAVDAVSGDALRIKISESDSPEVIEVSSIRSFTSRWR